MYIPPSSGSQDIQSSFESIVDFLDNIQISYPSCNVCILGDFNKAPINFLCHRLDLKNLVKENTRLNSLLDCCLISCHIFDDFFAKTEAPLSNSDHKIVCIHKNVLKTHQKKEISFLDFRQSNIANFQKDLASVNWTGFYQCEDINTKCEFFYNTIKTSMQSIPKCVVTYSSNDKQWITPICKHLINLRWKAYRQKNFSLYKHYQQKLKSEIVKSKKIWFKKCKTNRTGLWNIVKKAAPKKANDIMTLRMSHESTENLANRINDKLCQNFTTPSETALPTNSFSPLLNLYIDEKTVNDQMLKLKENKAIGSDGIPNKLLSTSALFLSKPLCHIFNTSLHSLTFPSLWKQSDICCIAKTKPADIEKLRPISLLPNISKIFERLVLDQIKNKFIQHIDRNQYGFLPKASTSTCLITMHDAITKELENSTTLAVTMISFDLRKAFDTLPHHQLIKKLQSFLPHNLCHFFQSYLTNRSQRVKVDNKYSRSQPILSGVPQGAILSPMLFNVFINDLSFGPDCYLIKYADDTTLILPHLSFNTSEEINCKIKLMKNWCSRHSLQLNASKTQIMTIKKNSNIAFHDLNKPHIEVLGVIFQENLKWDQQINKIFKKASRNIHILRILKQYISKKELFILYYSIIESILDYASSLYVKLPLKQERKINSVAKRCHRIICGEDCHCEKIHIPSKLREMRGIKLYKKAYNEADHSLNSLIPHKLPRTRKFFQPACISERRKRSFIPFITEVINNLS